MTPKLVPTAPSAVYDAIIRVEQEKRAKLDALWRAAWLSRVAGKAYAATAAADRDKERVALAVFNSSIDKLYAAVDALGPPPEIGR